MNRVRLLSLLCLPLLGCATTIGLPIEDRTRVFEEDFDTVFKATARALYAELGDGYEALASAHEIEQELLAREAGVAAWPPRRGSTRLKATGCGAAMESASWFSAERKSASWCCWTRLRERCLSTAKNPSEPEASG